MSSPNKKAAKSGVQALGDLPVLRNVKEELVKARRFWNGCLKPSLPEYKKLLLATGIGVFATGALGYAVKAVSYPIFRAMSEKA